MNVQVDLDKILEDAFETLEDDELEEFSDLMNKWLHITESEIEELEEE
jgi:predicted house-cleaning noncanonical NTP pyrophosphatase (MazG superfamily)